MRRKGFYRVAAALILLGAGFAGGVTSARFASKWPSHQVLVSLAERDRGDAPEAVRREVLRTFQTFQDGYTHRDVKQLSHLMETVFTRDRSILVLGIDPSEWVIGYEGAENLIAGDWLGWGDVTFAVDMATVSADGDVAWLATLGTVRFGKAERPIRFTAVLSRLGNRWVFRQIQYEWDVHRVSMVEFVVDPIKRWSARLLGRGNKITAR